MSPLMLSAIWLAPAQAGAPINWSNTASFSYRDPGQVYELDCPPGGVVTGKIYGTDVYTYDSPICVAAAHMGLISVERGGTVRMKPVEKHAAYTGSTRNNVKSLSYTPACPGYTFEAPARAAEPASIAGTWRLQTGGVLTIPAVPGTADFDLAYTTATGAKVLKAHRVGEGGELSFELEGEAIIASFDPERPGQLRLKSASGAVSTAARVN